MQKVTLVNDPQTTPLSLTQQEILLRQDFLGSQIYIIGNVTWLDGPLRVDLLDRAMRDVISAEPVLRSVVQRDPDGAHWSIRSDLDWRMPYIELACGPDEAADAEQEVRAYVEQIKREGIDPCTAPPWRFALLRAGPLRHAWINFYHHILIDGFGVQLAWQRMRERYNRLLAGDGEPLIPGPPGGRLAAQQRKYQQDTSRVERDRQFWEKRFAPAPDHVPLPPAEVRDLLPRLVQRRWTVPREQWQRFAALAKRMHVWPLQAMMALVSAYVTRVTRQEAIILGMFVHNRLQQDDLQALGLYVNTLPVRVSLSAQSSFTDLTQALAREIRLALGHQQYPLSQLLAQQPSCGGVAGMYYDLTVSTERFDYGGTFGEAQARVVPYNGHPALSPVAVYIRAFPDDGDLPVDFVIDPRAGAALTEADFLAARLDRLLGGVLDDPQKELCSIDLLGRAESDRLRLAFNNTSSAFFSESRIHELIALEAGRRPEAVAVQSGGSTRSFADVQARADSLARVLRGRGIGRGQRVGLCLHRTAEMPGTILGVLQAGACYVPLDPSYPHDRLAYMAGDARLSAILVSHRELRGLFADSGIPLIVLDDSELWEGVPATALEPDAQLDARPQDPAYMIYTSGSTGRPKGVLVPHRAVVNFLSSMAKTPGLGPDDRLLAVTTLSFDIAVLELLLPLCVGAQLIIADTDTARDPFALRALLESSGANVMQATPSTWRMLFDAGWTGKPDLRALIGGESLPVELAERLLETCGEVWNMYGPTETTVWSTCWKVERPREGISIGRPIANTSIWVLDANGQPCPIGVPGEIHIGGAGVTLGYFERPELTAERFIPDTFSDEPDARLYKTGDLGRWRHDGLLEHMGRLDHQVKVRGFRIELGEIEAALLEQPGVKQALVTVATRAERDGDVRLVAYVVPSRDTIDVPYLREKLRARLPDYMLPQHVVRLQQMPLLPNGKIDRSRLPPPDEQDQISHVAGASVKPPQTSTEKALWEIWREILRVDGFGVSDSFFALGGHSLLLTQMRSRIATRLKQELPLMDLFRLHTIADLAVHIDERRANLPDVVPIEIPRIARNQPLPVSLSQRRMWLIQQLDPDSAAYNVLLCLRFRGPFDAALFERVTDYLVQRHEGLRTSFIFDGDEPLQVIHPKIDGYFEKLDLSSLPPHQRLPEARRLLLQRAALPFDLARAPLHRLTLIKLADGDHLMFWRMHHVITDNWTIMLLIREMLHAYEALAAGQPDPGLPPLATEYADFAVWQRSATAASLRRHQMDYWMQHLAHLQPLHIPTDFVRPRLRSFRGARISVDLTQRMRDQIGNYCAQHFVTPFVVLLAAFKIMLARITQLADIAVGTPIANRHHALTENLFGALVNTLVMRTNLEGNPSFETVTQRVHDTAMEAFAHQDTPFDELVERLEEQRADFPDGLVSVLFNVLNAPLGRLVTVPFEYSEFDLGRVAAQFDLTLYVDTEFAHRVHVEYSTDIFTPATAGRFLDTYLFVLQQALDNPVRLLADFSLVPASVMQLLALDWNATRVPIALPSLIHKYVAAIDQAAPDKVATVDVSGKTLDYAGLSARRNVLARVLRGRGIGRGRRVGLCLHRTAEMPGTILGVLQAGACYVPLDPSYPHDRLAYMAGDARLSAILVSHRELRGLFADSGIPLIVLDDSELWEGVPATALEPDAQLDARPQDPAYMIYTSGSTGRPKGVLVPHRAVVNFLSSMAKTPGLGPDDRLLAVTTLSFDIAVLELLLPLCVGAQLIIADTDTARDPFALRALLESSGANVMQATPSTWRMLFDAGWTGKPDLRALIGGESLPVELAERLLETCGEVWNMYGPTETTVWSTCWKVERPREGISIGRPIANTSIWVLDANGQPCPIGVPGEIHIGGAGVTLGYFERPELTAERFIPDTFSDEPDARLYKTGDLGRWRHDGLLEHMGRLDHQVKVRGFRIELGEIEAALLEQPGVKQALVTVATRAERDGDVRLVAYVVPSRDTIDVPYLREKLRARLPDYMLPQHVVRLQQMPLLPNGKIDRSRLPAPDNGQSVTPAARQPGRPLTPQEMVLAEIWSELLGMGNIAPADNFFELGGHSLLAMQAIVRTEKRLGIHIHPRRMIFETLEQLASSDALHPGQATAPAQANSITAITTGAKPAAEPRKGLVKSIARRLGLG